jgi:hypothetical protein
MFDRPACLATGTIDIEPRRSGGDGAADRGGPQPRAFGVPSPDNAEGSLTGGFFGRMGDLVGGTLSPQGGDARGLTVRVVIGHIVAIIGRQLSKVQLGGWYCRSR